ncbi:MAG: glycoside hydrolase family 18 protein, partial [Chloroflexi bacterium]|nr:glycoside hydrolase family 18 protein [Chloroflexota bacterium]
MKRTALPILSLSLALVWLAGILLGGCAPASPAPRPTVGTLPTSTPMLAQALTLPAAAPSESPFPKNTPPPSPTNPHTATPSSATATPTHPPTPTSAPSPSPAPGALVAGSQSKPVPAKAVLSLSRGEYVTGSANPNEAEIAWMSRFRIVHAGGLLDPLPTDVIARLRQAGVQILLVYDWLPATYHYTDGESDDPLTQWLYDNRDWATLNPNGPFPHCTEEGYDWCEDYYFDLGDANVRQARVDYLVQTVHDLGYDGVFFDWSNSQFLDEDTFATIRETYETRHPDLPYAEAIALFYQALRDAGLIVQSNQGFRDAQAILPQVDYDMTESYGTTDETFGKRLR